jgi:hypothetical protein
MFKLGLALRQNLKWLGQKAVCLVLVLLLCLFSTPAGAIAQPLNQFNPAVTFTHITIHHYGTLAFLRWLFGRRPKRDDRPAETESAGRRGKCSNVRQTFVGFVPPVEEPVQVSNTPIPSTEVKSFVGLTTQEFPTLWFHMPELPDDVKMLELMLQDEQSIDVIDQPIAISVAGGSGVYSINWEISGVPLELDKSYHWYLSIVCDAERPSRNPSIDAWVERVSPTQTVQTQLSSATNERERVELYINDGIWHDALTQLARLRCQAPGNEGLIEDWITLLESIGIQEEIAIAPILQCPRES